MGGKTPIKEKGWGGGRSGEKVVGEKGSWVGEDRAQGDEGVAASRPGGDEARHEGGGVGACS